MDRDAYLERKPNKMPKLADARKEREVLAAFIRFMQNYLQSKAYLQENDLLDCYDSLLEALVHWATLAVIEEGQLPASPIWDQIRFVNLGIYKLHEELTTSDESLIQRLQLVLLACEFSVFSKMSESCRALLSLLDACREPMTVQEIRQALGLEDESLHIAPVLRKLAERELVREVVVPVDETLSRVELKYLRCARMRTETPGSATS